MNSSLISAECSRIRSDTRFALVGDQWWWSVQIVQELTFKRQRQSARTSSTTSFVHIRLILVFVCQCMCVHVCLCEYLSVCVCVSSSVCECDCMCVYLSVCPNAVPMHTYTHIQYQPFCTSGIYVCWCICAYIALLVQITLPSYKPSDKMIQRAKIYFSSTVLVFITFPVYQHLRTNLTLWNKLCNWMKRLFFVVERI